MGRAPNINIAPDPEASSPRSRRHRINLNSETVQSVTSSIESLARGFSEMSLELGEGVLHRVEIGTVGREVGLHSAASIISRTRGPLWLERLSMMTMSPGRS